MLLNDGLVLICFSGVYLALGGRIQSDLLRGSKILGTKLSYRSWILVSPSSPSCPSPSSSSSDPSLDCERLLSLSDILDDLLLIPSLSVISEAMSIFSTSDIGIGNGNSLPFISEIVTSSLFAFASLIEGKDAGRLFSL
ncbi:Rfm1p [Saccharomyces cerevisiae Lalvin QA23]|nr:Rfm1p [Saccharomyces cerevisiae Lalvin QA23]